MKPETMCVPNRITVERDYKGYSIVMNQNPHTYELTYHVVNELNGATDSVAMLYPQDPKGSKTNSTNITWSMSPATCLDGTFHGSLVDAHKAAMQHAHRNINSLTTRSTRKRNLVSTYHHFIEKTYFNAVKEGHHIDESETLTDTGIITGDVLDILPHLMARQERYDLVIADPPYNIGKDFGNNKTKKPIAEYVKWAMDWIDSCRDLLTERGLLYVYGLPETVATISARYPIDEQRWLVWHYTNKTVPQMKFWQRSHETILCLWRPDAPRPSLEVNQVREPYHPISIQNHGKTRKSTPSRFNKANVHSTYFAHPLGALPRDVIKVPALAGGAGNAERWFICITCGGGINEPKRIKEHHNHDVLKHPTQKPMKLTEQLIKSRINGTVGGKVLVPFAGSGSECVVARSMGLDFLGIEINPDFADFARQWIRRTADRRQETRLT